MTATIVVNFFTDDFPWMTGVRYELVSGKQYTLYTNVARDPLHVALSNGELIFTAVDGSKLYVAPFRISDEMRAVEFTINGGRGFKTTKYRFEYWMLCVV
jgi:hypothetical protein